MQLLMNQAPISVLVMLYVIPVADDVTVWRDVGWGVYGLIGIVSCFFFLFLFLFSFFSVFSSLSLFGFRFEKERKHVPWLTRRDIFLSKKSGLLACLINLSQFVIIHEAGPVSSTVVGHFKTCSIVAMGWIVSGKSLTDGSLVGILLAIGGIIS